MRNPNGSLTQNGWFFEAATKYRSGMEEPELVKVYEKIRSGIWVFNGFFKLVESWQEDSNSRTVFKFRLELTDDNVELEDVDDQDLDHNRLIPTVVKIDVWKRDKGRYTKCGSDNNLHFDHIIPYSKGGASLVSKNIQLLCARHNFRKRARIE